MMNKRTIFHDDEISTHNFDQLQYVLVNLQKFDAEMTEIINLPRPAKFEYGQDMSFAN